MKPTKPILVVAIAIVATAAGARAASERRAERKIAAEIDLLTSTVAPLANEHDGSIVMNGAPLVFRRTSQQGATNDVMARVAKECANGSADTALGYASGENRSISLERVVEQQGEDGVRASLCVFAPENGAPEDAARRVRYTLAQERGDGTVAVTTIVSPSATPLEKLFPADGDAPGSDPVAIARPDDARRTLTVVGTHTVRVYESSVPVERSVERYDAKMASMGFTVSASLSDARMYRKEGQSYVASFRATTEGSTIALMPFDASS